MPTTFFAIASRFAAATATALAIAACGGGGSDSPAPASAPSTPATTTFPLAAAMASFARDTRTVPFTVSGTGTSSTQTISFTGSGNLTSSIVAGTFEGVPAQVKTQTTTGTVMAQGTSSALVDTSVAFYDSSYRPLGSSSGSNYCVNSGTAAFPVTVKVGDTGIWHSATCYTSRTKSVRLSTATLSYAIDPLTATSVILRITQKATPLIGTVSVPELTTFYTITTDGAATARETPLTDTRDGVTINLVFKFL